MRSGSFPLMIRSGLKKSPRQLGNFVAAHVRHVSVAENTRFTNSCRATDSNVTLTAQLANNGVWGKKGPVLQTRPLESHTSEGLTRELMLAVVHFVAQLSLCYMVLRVRVTVIIKVHLFTFRLINVLVQWF